MKKGFSEAFNVTNKYIVLATPLILYSLFTSVYLAASATGKLINLLIALVLFTLMTAAFIAGWFNMIKIAIVAPQRDDANSLIKEFIRDEDIVSSFEIRLQFHLLALAFIEKNLPQLNNVSSLISTLRAVLFTRFRYSEKERIFELFDKKFADFGVRIADLSGT